MSRLVAARSESVVRARSASTCGFSAGASGGFEPWLQPSNDSKIRTTPRRNREEPAAGMIGPGLGSPLPVVSEDSLPSSLTTDHVQLPARQTQQGRRAVPVGVLEAELLFDKRVPPQPVLLPQQTQRLQPADADRWDRHHGPVAAVDQLAAYCLVL